MLFPFETSMPTEFISIPLLIADSIYWVTRTLWLNLLKSNAATRGWLTVFLPDFIAQERSGQSVAPLIAALARDGWNPPAGCRGFHPNYIVIERRKEKCSFQKEFRALRVQFS
jgi:hypothetical protein